MWNASSSDGEACVAAQINQLVDYDTKYAFFGQMMAATVICYANSSSIKLPEASTDTAVTFDATQLTDLGFTDANSKVVTATSVVVSYVADADANAGQKFEISGTADSKTFQIIMVYAKRASSGYRGVVSYVFRLPSANIGGCDPVGSSPAGTMVFSRADKSSDVQISLETGEFCGTSVNPFIGSVGAVSSISVDSCDKKDATFTGDTNTSAEGWAGNWNRVIFNYDPDTLIGKYSYAWQAGKSDGNSRVFNAEISTASAGVGYFGFGPDVSTIASGACTKDADLGEVTKMICNWAGPNNSHTGVTKLQKQTMAKTAGKWTAGTSSITFAPTNSCDLAGAGNLIYCANACTADCTSGATDTLDHATGSVDVTNNLESLSTYTTDFGAQPTAPTF